MDSGQYISPGCIPLKSISFFNAILSKVDDSTVSETLIRKITFYIS